MQCSGTREKAKRYARCCVCVCVVVVISGSAVAMCFSKEPEESHCRKQKYPGHRKQTKETNDRERYERSRCRSNHHGFGTGGGGTGGCCAPPPPLSAEPAAAAARLARSSLNPASTARLLGA